MAARRRAIWSPEALSDISGIWDYYANVAGEVTADRLLHDIRRVVAMLEDYPSAGRARDGIRLGLRSAVSGLHVIFYRLSEQGPLIVRVLDGRRDFEETFSDLSEA